MDAVERFASILGAFHRKTFIKQDIGQHRQNAWFIVNE